MGELDPVGQMLLAIEREDAVFWAMPIVTALESECTGKALDWAIVLVIGECRDLDEDVRALYQGWLRALASIKTHAPDGESVNRLIDDIWYHEGDRDGVRRAIARLYAAVGRLARGDDVGYRKEIAAAVCAIAGGVGARPNAACVARIVELFREHSGRDPR